MSPEAAIASLGSDPDPHEALLLLYPEPYCMSQRQIAQALGMNVHRVQRAARNLSKWGRLEMRTRPQQVALVMASAPLTDAQQAALDIVRRGAITAADLGRALGMTRVKAHDVLQQLRRRGHVHIVGRTEPQGAMRRNYLWGAVE